MSEFTIHLLLENDFHLELLVLAQNYLPQHSLMDPQPLNKCGVELPPLRRVNRRFTMSSRKRLQISLNKRVVGIAALPRLFIPKFPSNRNVCMKNGTLRIGTLAEFLNSTAYTIEKVGRQSGARRTTRVRY